jgi:hypothetical protein
VVWHHSFTLCKHPALIPASIRHSKCARHVRHGRGNAIKHFPNVRRAPSKSIPLGIPLLPHCRWTHSNGNRRNLTCKYLTPEQNRNSASVSDRLWYDFRVDDDRADVQPIDFPTMLFLDPGILQHGQVEISRAATPVPAHVLNFLGDMTEIRSPHPNSLSTYTCICHLSLRNASTNSTCGHHSILGQTLSFFFFLSS